MSVFSRHSGGFSLVEILLSLLILAGTLVTIMSGIQVSHELSQQARFEENAAFFAEREMEMLKSDLLAGRAKLTPGLSHGRFRLPAGWQTKLTWNQPDHIGILKIACQVMYQQSRVNIESHLYLPVAAAPVTAPKGGSS
jgi:type II secretory pathway pseudopilin PulG